MPADDPLALPRSVRLALWLRSMASTASPASPEQVAAAVEDDDEPHRVSGAGGVTDLTGLVRQWSGAVSAATLPAPGDPCGTPAAADAVDAGECVLLQRHGDPGAPEGAASVALVPVVERFGSDLEPGHLVTWHVRPVPPWVVGLVGALGTPAEAEQELRGVLREATEALAALDVARWREDAADAVARLGGDGPLPWRLPDVLDGRRVRVLAQAARLRAIVALATADDGGAVNLWQADQRSTALREVDRVARRAMAAVTLP